MKKYFVTVLMLLLCGICAKHTPAQTPNYIGFLDTGDCSSISGWAADKNRPNTPINVSIYDGTTLLTTVSANASRADSAAIAADVGNGDNGIHAFGVATPASLKNGLSHSISARFESTSIDLTNSPRSITCGPTGFTIPNPKITTFEISKTSSRASTQLNGFDLSGIDATTNPSLNLRVEIDHPERVHFFRLGEIACPESVSDHPEDRMKNLPWQTYSQGQSFSFRLNTDLAQPYGTRCVFMEVNRTQNESSASSAKGDSIVLAPAHLKTFTLTGAALTNFLDRAKTLGYKFTLTDHSFTGEDPCPAGTIPDSKTLTPASGSAAILFETTVAKLFDRNEGRLNPFWKMTGITIPGGTGVSVTFSGPPSGRADDPFRTVGIKHGFTFTNGAASTIVSTASNGSTDCVAAVETIPRPFDTGKITSITLEGPDDKQPADAFFNPNPTLPRILIRPNFKIGP